MSTYASRLADTAANEMTSGPDRRSHRAIIEGVIKQVIERCAVEAETRLTGDMTDYGQMQDGGVKLAVEAIRALAGAKP